LTGLSLTDAVQLLLRHDRRYLARTAGGVLNIRPLGAIDAPDDFLNRVLPRFELDHRPLSEALHAVHLAVDPGYRLPPRHPGRLHTLTQRDPERAAVVRAALDRPVTVSLTNSAVRDVLNAMAVADGEMWWYVSYRSNLGVYLESKITFAGFDNWAIAAEAQPRGVRPSQLPPVQR
jgi:hypothetical protein